MCADFLAAAFPWDRLLQNPSLALGLLFGGFSLPFHFEPPCLCFSYFFMKPFRENILVLFYLVNFVFLLFLPFVIFASFLSTMFSHILFSNPRYFHSGLSGFCALHALICFVFFIYPSLAGWFFVLFFLVSLVLLSAYDHKTRFPAILFLFTTDLTICDTRKLYFRVFFPRFCPPSALFQNPSLFLVFCCLVFFFCLPFQHSTFNRFWDNILVCFFCSIHVARFLSSLVLPYFKQVSWHPLLKSNSLSFLVVWLFYSSYLNDNVFRPAVSFFL